MNIIPYFLGSSSFDDDILDWCNKFSNYLSSDELYDAIDQIAKKNSQVNVKTIGHSFEERAIKVVQIKKVAENNLQNVYIQAGSHAREWIGISSILYFIERLARLMEVHFFFILQLSTIFLSFDL